MPDYRTPRAVPVVELVGSVADKQLLSLDMPELENRAPVHISGQLDSLSLRVEALDLPVVSIIALSVVSKARDLVLPRDRTLDVVAMEVLTSLDVLESDYLTAFHRLPCDTRCLILAFFYGPQVGHIIVLFLTSYNLLARATTVTHLS